jgi:cytochrome P450
MDEPARPGPLRSQDRRMFSDPHGYFADVAAEATVVRDHDEGWWVLERSLAAEVLRDRRFAKDTRHAMPGSRYRTDAETGRHRSLLGLDDPDHGRLRALVAPAFSQRSVAALAPRVEAVVDGLLDDVGPTFDVIDALAVPLPIIMIAELLGVDPADRDRFAMWSRDLAERHRGRVTRTALALYRYLGRVVADRRRNGGPGLIGDLVRAQERGERLSEAELIDLVILLLVTGNFTTTDLIGNTVLALLRRRREWERVVADPSLAPAAVEAALRFASPVVVTGRFATEDVELGGCPVQAGEIVFTALGTEDPDGFRLEGEPQQHAFGGGVHFCLGAALARREATIAVRALATRFPGLSLTSDDVEWREAEGFHGPASLPVAT